MWLDRICATPPCHTCPCQQKQIHLNQASHQMLATVTGVGLWTLWKRRAKLLVIFSLLCLVLVQPDSLQFLPLVPSLETSDCAVLAAALQEKKNTAKSLGDQDGQCLQDNCSGNVRGERFSSCQVPFRCVLHGDCTERKGSPLARIKPWTGSQLVSFPLT